MEPVRFVVFFEDEPEIHPVIPLKGRFIGYGDVLAGLCDDRALPGFVEPDPGCDVFAVLLERTLIQALLHLGAEIAGVRRIVIFIEAGKEVLGDRVCVGKHLRRIIIGDD